MNRYLLLSLISYCAAQSFNIDHDYRGFDDSILFAIKWPGSKTSIDDLVQKTNEETTPPQIKIKEVLNVKTTNNEHYQCNIPELILNETPSIEDYHGPSPLATLKPLFSQKVCSYRLESYWAYEVCHGRYVRQYHEEREGKHVKTQQYYLGMLDTEKQKKLETEMLDVDYVKNKPNYTKIDGVAMPYVEMVLSDGTQCELVGKPRVTRILYVCYSHAKHEIYSFKETSTCEYEIVVLSPLLCTHPQFMPKTTTENVIECLSESTEAAKPKNMMILENSLKTLPDVKQANDVLAVLKVEKVKKDGETHLMIELLPLEEPSLESLTSNSDAKALPDKSPTTSPFNDHAPVNSFLSGEECLTGDSGWWKYEFCYGKHVKQYHESRNGERVVVKLGEFDQEVHKRWINDNKEKAPAPLATRKSVSHFYSNGDFCEKTGKPRQTEVKLKCIDASKPLSIYLLEPKTCNYIVGVESPLICEILPLVNEYGLVEASSVVKKMTDDKEDKTLEDFLKEIANKL